jgi:CheY-like chemotaxis protein
MPGMSGPELAAQIRSTSSDDRLPVIFISGYAESPVRGGLEQPATGFLAKPYRLADLVDAVREITHPLP